MGRIVLGSMCVGVPVWLGWSGIRVAGFHFLCAQHVSGINTSIIRSLRLFLFITTLVVCSCFDVCWRFGVAGLGWYPCSRLQPATLQPNHTETPTHIEPRTIRPMS